VRKMAFPCLLLIACAIAAFSWTASASSEDKQRAGSLLTSSPAQENPGALVTQKVTTEPEADPKSTHPRQNQAFAPTQDNNNRQKGSVETPQPAPSKQPPGPPQRLRIVVIKN